MRKFLYSLLALTIFAACSTEEEMTFPVGGEELVTVYVEAEQGEDSRVALNGNTTTWEVGDKLNVALTNAASTKYYTFEIQSAEDITDNGKYARFTGSVPAGSYTKVIALYTVDSASGSVVVNRRAEDNLFMEAVESYPAGEELTISGSAAVSIPMEFSLLMHKIDYTLSVAAGCDTDVSKGVAIEMLIRSNDAEVKSVQCYNYDAANGGFSGVAASSSATLADFTTHNFNATATASTLVFPMTTISNAELTFNVYVAGHKAHTIVKKANSIAFTAGRTTSVNLPLSEENKSVAEVEESGPAIDGVDAYLTSIVDSGSLYYGGNKFTVTGENGVSFTLVVKAANSMIAEGTYAQQSSTAYAGASDKFAIMEAKNIPNMSGVGAPNGNTGTMTVSKSGDKHIIDLVIKHNSSSAHLVFIGQLNVENGGQTGGGSSEVADITLSSLVVDDSNSANGYYTFYGESATGDAISFNINSNGATANSIAAAAYEHIAAQYCNLNGYFNAQEIVVGGASKSAKSGVLYVTKGGSTPTLHADITFSAATSRHFIFDGAITKPVIEGDITISASQNSIKGNGVDSVTFTAMQDSINVTGACTFYVNDTALGSASFSSTEPGTYTVYAKKGTKRSNELTITVVEYVPSALTITASKSSIAADGSDSTSFTVKADSSIDVTSSCSIYVNSSKVYSSTFKSGTAGEYSVYATYKGVKSNTITITAKASEKVILFAKGVSFNSGWYDVNKKAQGNNGDINMCWAATSSNMIQWWQDRYKEAGGTLPAGCPDGVGTKHYTNYGPYELAIMEVFHSQWNNDKGCHAVEAIPWYFEGVNYGETASAGSQAYPLTAGGYWKNIWSSIYPNLYHGYNYMFNWYKNLYTGSFLAYTGWDEACSESATKYGTDAHLAFSNRVIEFLQRGITELTIALNSSGGLSHATTLWGCEYDKTTGLVTRIWITDSDDLESEPKQQLLNEYAVSTMDGNYRVKLTGNTRYGTAYANELQPLSGYGSAE